MPSPKQSTAPLIEAHTRADWRTWLAANHTTSTGAWLVTYKKSSGQPHLSYADAVEEALCFGWIDSVAGKVDDLRSKLWFAPRQPKSAWSKLNKERIAQLTAAGLIAPAGQAAIDTAKQNGAWSALDDVENFVVPTDLAEALDADPIARTNFDAFPNSVRKGILDTVRTAVRPDTRARRIHDIVTLAAQNRRYGFERK